MSELRAQHIIRTLAVVFVALCAGIALLTFGYHQAKAIAAREARLADEQVQFLGRFTAALESFGALNNGPTAQIMVRPDTLLIHNITDAGERITGRSMTSVRGQHINTIIPDWIITPMLEALRSHPGKAVEFTGGEVRFGVNGKEASVALLYRARWNVDDFIVFEMTDVNDRVQIPQPAPPLE